MPDRFVMSENPAVDSPTETIPLAERLDENGRALCMSGGGYRAMVFHLGALWRLNELGLLPTLTRISSVSGGSITAAVLGLRWSRLQFTNAIATRFREEVVDAVLAFADRTIDQGSILSGIFTPGSIADKVTEAYRKHLFGDTTLQDLPVTPRFVINASNVQTGALWRFSRPYMADYKVGRVLNPRVPLAVAVAASSAFPPVLSPLKLEIDESQYDPASNGSLHRPPFTTDVVLTDGGVYDNLGLETAWKRCLRHVDRYLLRRQQRRGRGKADFIRPNPSRRRICNDPLRLGQKRGTKRGLVPELCGDRDRVSVQRDGHYEAEPKQNQLRLALVPA